MSQSKKPGDEDSPGKGNQDQPDESEATEQSLASCIKNRAALRRSITNTYKIVQAKCHRKNEKISREQCERATAELIHWDGLINDDTGGHYYEHLKEMMNQFDLDDQEADAAALRAQKRAIADQELALVNAQLAVAQASLASAATPAAATSPASTSAVAAPAAAIPRIIYSAKNDDFRLEAFDGSPCHYRQFELLFEELYEKNSAYSEAERFLAFKNRVGPKGREFIANLKPTAAGLKTAKERMKDFFDDATRVREDVRRRFEKLPTIKYPSQTQLLRSLLIDVEEGVEALKDCGTNISTINTVYLTMVTNKLPRPIVSSYMKNNTTKDIDELIKHLTAKIKKEIEVNELIGVAQESVPKSSTKIHVVTPANSTSNSSTNPSVAQRPSFPSIKCDICEADHKTIFCTAFDSSKRKDIVTRKRLCYRCLRPNHSSTACKSSYTCTSCGNPHSKVICQQDNSNRQQSNQLAGLQQTTPKRQQMHTSTGSTQTSTEQHRSDTNVTNGTTVHTAVTQVCQFSPVQSETNEIYRNPARVVTYYQTALVKVNGIITRALFDSGAGRSMMLTSLANQFDDPQLEPQDLYVGLSGINKPVRSRHTSKVTIQGVNSDYSMQMIFSVVDTLGAMKMACIPDDLMNKINKRGISIFDATEQEEHRFPIQLILGAEYYSGLWLGNDVAITEQFYVRESVFGWIGHGCVSKSNGSASVQVHLIIANNNTDMQLSPLPIVGNEPQRVEQRYIQYFVNNKVRFCDGRYFVSLPWILPINMGNNRYSSKRRLERLLKSLMNRNLLGQYSEAMNEMVGSFAERAPAQSDPIKTYFMPHHCVLRLDKTTTQTRIVFDGSSHDTGTLPLNDNLFKGASQWNAFNLFVQFRMGTTAVIADVEKAFLQIKVEPEDRDALRFWWLDTNGVPIEYRFTSVPFGTSASPFLLFAALTHLFTFNRVEYADVIPLIQNQFYVDDLLLALSDVSTDQVNQIKTRIVSLFQTASLNIRKWRSNNLELDNKWSPDAPRTVKVLGYMWNVETDTLSPAIDIVPFLQPLTLTKRVFSSFAASIYDPMGYLLPFIVTIRLFIRKLWQLKLDWDDPLPSEFIQIAQQLISDAALANQVAVPRNVLPSSGSTKTLMVFCDASKQAVGVSAYCRVDSEITLLIAKATLSRDATIAELELDALIMAATTVQQLTALQSFEEIVICGDSLLNLQRLVQHPNAQKPSLALRIAQIKQLSNVTFRHVESADNIADLITRGSSLSKLIHNTDWWSSIPLQSHSRFNQKLTPQAITWYASVLDFKCECHRFRSYGMAVNTFRRIAVYLISRRNIEQYQSQSEFVIALSLLIRSTQREHFKSEITALEEGQQIDGASVLRNYKCFIDKDGVLRLMTRLQLAADLNYDQMNPIIMPKNCHISRLIVMNEHQRIIHSGVNRTLESVRGRYYIIGFRTLVMQVCRDCRICKWLAANTPKPDFGSVPSFRQAHATPPFTHTGLDIFGPLKIKLKSKTKRYGVIFSCATTRAVHLEVVHDMTAESVFQAMRRFFGRRGYPSLIYSDNGTQLLAIKHRFKNMLDKLSAAHPSHEIRLKWIHLTASSPWRGGFYERLIRSTKEALCAITFKREIDDNELSTVFAEVESKLNSRPLFLSDKRIITPSHFFAGKPINQLPPIGNIVAGSMSRDGIVDTYIKSQRAVNAFWRDWRAQYLLMLRNFHENPPRSGNQVNFRVGDVVIIKDATQLDTWHLGKIERLIPSPDGTVRTVELRTTERGRDTTKIKSVQTLIPLEGGLQHSTGNSTDEILQNHDH